MAGDKQKMSEKGLLTPRNCVVAMIDLQPLMLVGVSDFDRQSIINSNLLLAKAAKVFDIPVVVTTIEAKEFGGNLLPQVQAVYPDLRPIERTEISAWDNAAFVAAVKKSGRRNLVLAGLWTGTCIGLAALQAAYDDYAVLVAEDCCGDVSRLAHDNAMKRMLRSAVAPVTALSLMLEWQRDWADEDTYDAVMDIVQTHCGAYGAAVEYVYTMVHGAPPRRLPAYEVPKAGVPMRIESARKKAVGA